MKGNQGVIGRTLDKLASLVDFIIRASLFHVFFISGLYKWNHWDETFKALQSRLCRFFSIC